MAGEIMSMSKDEKFIAYWNLVREYSTSMNLTGWSSYDTWQNLGIEPSLQFSSVVDNGMSVLDIGSGQGLPGVVIAIVHPESHVTLVEPRVKRSAFLKLVKHRLNLNVDIITNRVQEVCGYYDIITSRAVASPDVICRWSEHLAHDKTKWVLRKPEKSCEYFVNNRISYVSYE